MSSTGGTPRRGRGGGRSDMVPGESSVPRHSAGSLNRGGAGSTSSSPLTAVASSPAVRTPHRGSSHQTGPSTTSSSSSNTGRRLPNHGTRSGSRGGRTPHRQHSRDDHTSTNNTNSNNNNYHNHHNNGGSHSENYSGGGSRSVGRDEDILIAFMPFLKGNNYEASKIYEDYQASNDLRAFLAAAREFLEHFRNSGLPHEGSTSAFPTTGGTEELLKSQIPPPSLPSSHVQHHNSLPQFPATNESATPPLPAASSSMPSSLQVVKSSMMTPSPTIPSNSPASSQFPSLFSSSSNNASLPINASFPTTPVRNSDQIDVPIMSSTNLKLPRPPPTDSQLNASRMPQLFHSHLATSVPSSTSLPSSSFPTVEPHVHVKNHTLLAQNPSSNDLDMLSMEKSLDALFADSIQDPLPLTLPAGLSSIWGTPPVPTMAPTRGPSSITASMVKTTGAEQPSLTTSSSSPPWPATSLVSEPASLIIGPAPGFKTLAKREPGDDLATATISTPELNADESLVPPEEVTSKTPPTAKKEPPPARRVWMNFEDQPGRIFVNGVNGKDLTLVLPFGPREELTANWSLPLDYLREKAAKASTIEEAMQHLAIGLFRRGCNENGSLAAIISKPVLGDESRAFKFWKDSATNSIQGSVPFYSPRTPGHVIFRMYWENDPTYTLAMGPSLYVRVLERDFESSIRFILSNFKGKKHNPTSLSSLHALASILETPLSRPNESAARATWGCVQEARKVLEACFQEYTKSTERLGQLEASVEELRKQVEDEGAAKTTNTSTDLSDDDGDLLDQDDHAVVPPAVAMLREKTRMLLSGRASSERKWRDSQLAFAGILRAVVTHPSMSILLRRDLLTKMRLEFELWCPLSEEFAIPSDTAAMWFEPIRDLPHTITPDDFRTFAQARVKMQLRTLGFDPNTFTLDDILFPRNRGTPAIRSMDPGAVGVFNSMSAAMGQYFQQLFINEEQVSRKREMIRQRTEECVRESGAFPPGSKVVIFGSAANGFGSPKSDIDMCLQLPDGYTLDSDDATGSAAMAKLADHFRESGMKEVDTVRLTARIPIIMYQCVDPLSTSDSEGALIECDLSMHNPLAVLNTSLLRAYADITPVTRVLAIVIKRWAKARDINNPARHTLSSYGYIIMLLHFLTYHKRNGNGLVSPVAPPEGYPQLRQQSADQPTPILPNLQWMDPMWPNFTKGTPYRDVIEIPRQPMQHPLIQDKTVNSHFYQPKTPNEKTVLQMLFPGQDLSLAILLASFFRYYAYEFDYKRYTVSLHSTASRGIVEREIKAELDGWRNYSAALTIEDPFETFYDIAHVLRGGYYHRIRREFAVAYSKIADVAAGRPGSWNKGELRKMTGQELLDWICEPVATPETETTADS